jgi:hypothetical protein
MLPRSSSRALVAAAAVLALGSLAACGDDDGALSGATDDRATTTVVVDPTTTDPPETTGGSGDPAAGDFCAAAADIAEGDAAYNEQLSAALEPITTAAASGDEDAMDAALDDFVAEVKRFDELLPEIDAAYGELHDAAPEDMREDIETLRTFTADFVADLQDVRTFDDLDAMFEDLDGATEAGLAALSVDSYTRDTCGFSINNE